MNRLIFHYLIILFLIFVSDIAAHASERPSEAPDPKEKWEMFYEKDVELSDAIEQFE